MVSPFAWLRSWLLRSWLAELAISREHESVHESSHHANFYSRDRHVVLGVLDSIVMNVCLANLRGYAQKLNDFNVGTFYLRLF